MADERNNPTQAQAQAQGKPELLPELPPELDLMLPQPPFWMIALFLVLVVLTWVPLVMIARARVTTSTKPRVHLFQDMDNQPRFRTQTATKLFADGRAMRPTVTGTIARGELDEDDHMYRGYELRVNAETGEPEPSFFVGFPGEIEITQGLVLRGQQRFNIYCATCHGSDGHGQGPVNQRALELASVGKASWVQAASLHSDTVRDRPEGHLFNTITDGINNMPAYGSQISPHDRWAIVAYIRALQISQHNVATQIQPPPDDGEQTQ